MGKLSWVSASAPATSANLGPGFDVFGVALSAPTDTVTVKKTGESGITLKANSPAPIDPNRNTSGVVAQALLHEFNLNSGLAISVEKGVPVGSGLGSSAASAAATAVAMNRLFDLSLDANSLIRFAAKGEKASAGVEHADNVSAAILGGFIIILSYDPLEVSRLKPPRNLTLCVTSPLMSVPEGKTGVARSVIPKMVSLDNMIHNVGHAASIVAGFSLGDISLIGKGMSDSVVEPARKHMIPGYDLIRRKAFKAGALGVAISGAGPSMIAVVDDTKVKPSLVAEAMKDGFREVGLSSTAFCSKVGEGAQLLGEE